MSNGRSSPYDRIASVYDRLWTGRYHPAALPVIQKILKREAAPPAALLDVCCGTAIISSALSLDGYTVTGVDASEGMIARARANCPEGEFHVGDVAEMGFRERFGAAISTFDSLNHIVDEAALCGVLHAVARALKQGGVFLFDMNMREAYVEEWGKSSFTVADDEVCIVRGGFDETTEIGWTEVTQFLLEDGWKRYDAAFRQRCYQAADVERWLHAAGYGTVNSMAAEDAGMQGDIARGRRIFIAHKG